MIEQTHIEILQDIPLAPLTTLKVGGTARYFVRAESEDQVHKAFEFAAEQDLEVFILGGGSNIVVSDTGFDGLVVQIALKGVLSERSALADGSTLPDADRDGSRDIILITAQAGEDWDEFVRHCVEQDLAGVECLSGIPGLVGGTPVQNVGAYGQEVSETIVTVRCFDRTKNEIVELSNAECGFSYRKSIFNSDESGRHVVLSVTYALKPHGLPKIVYKDIREYFGSIQPTLKETRDAVLQIRGAKSMVISPNDPNSQSVGSFFKNPIISKEMFAQLTAKADAESIPHFPMDDCNVKVPAAWLIEQSGFKKGFRMGNVGISTNHSLAIVNFGAATAKEVIELKQLIQKGVKERFDIYLHPEPIFVGF
ncbi:MAG: UDP-N-acetylmuramate dehydrogenase [Blastocatellia bacterium]